MEPYRVDRKKMVGTSVDYLNPCFSLLEARIMVGYGSYLIFKVFGNHPLMSFGT
jgi:hypothetical protein